MPDDFKYGMDEKIGIKIRKCLRCPVSASEFGNTRFILSPELLYLSDEEETRSFVTYKDALMPIYFEGHY